MWSFFRQLNWYKNFLYIYIYIPYGQVIRIKRTCSNPEQVKLRLEDLSNWLVNRGYKQEIVSQQIHRVDAIDRETLLIKHPKQNNIETLTLILTYHPALKMFMRYSAKHIIILWSHQDCNMFYQHNQELLFEMINHWKINLFDQN